MLCISFTLINPVFTILFYTIYLVSSKERLNILDTKTSLHILAIGFAAFLGYINVTKELTSDLYVYYLDFISHDSYSDAPQLITIIKDPFFVYGTFLFNKLSAGNFKLYIFGITFISYLLLFLSYINILYDDSPREKSHVIASLIMLLLFFELFSLSAHLIRYFLAGSLFFYGFSLKQLKKRFYVVFYLSAILIHSSVALLILMSFVPYLHSRGLFFNLLLVITALLLGFFISKIFNFNFGTFSQSLSFLDTPLDRIRHSYIIEGDVSVFQTFAALVVCVIVLAICYLESKYQVAPRLAILAQIFFGILAFAILVNEQLLLARRLFYYLYFLMPPMIVLIAKQIFEKHSLRNLFYCSSICILLLRFIYKYAYGTFQYLPLHDLVVTPAIVVLLNG